jgi:TatD DNase family protein
MELIDIGLNLTHESFAADRAQVIAQARAAGVAQMIITGSGLANSLRALELARAHPQLLFATAGVHPHHASELSTQELPRLRELLAHDAVVAVGECGLDYYRNLSPQSAQRQAFGLQLRLAADTGKPLFLHQRDAHADFIAMLREHRTVLGAGVAHCFTGGAQELEDYLALGLHVGITGWICDERRGAHLKALMPRIPSERLMIETDAPYLLPRDLMPKPQGRRNEPRWLPHIAAAVAAARSEELSAVARSSTTAARALFRLPAAPILSKRPEIEEINI